MGDERGKTPGHYHATGAGILGLPGINIGHNQHVAWTHTVATTDTLKFEYMPGASSGTYYWKGKTEKIKKLAVTVQALEHGELVPHTKTLYYSNYGPVFWDSKLPIAVADANATNLRGPDQWLAISKAEDAAQVIEAERTIQGVPWVNTIGADDQGNAFYTKIAVASDLTKALVNGSCNLWPSGHRPVH